MSLALLGKLEPQTTLKAGDLRTHRCIMASAQASNIIRLKSPSKRPSRLERHVVPALPEFEPRRNTWLTALCFKWTSLGFPFLFLHALQKDTSSL